VRIGSIVTVKRVRNTVTDASMFSVYENIVGKKAVVTDLVKSEFCLWDYVAETECGKKLYFVKNDLKLIKK
jgi:hypothetical protein